MRNVVLYNHPESALCVRCKNGEMINSNTDSELSEYEALCFINSSNNNGISCKEFNIDVLKKELYSTLDDFEGYFDLPEIEKEIS